MPSLLANILFFGLIAGFSALSVLSPDAYYQNVQEDQPLEWSTFWAFLLAGALFAKAALSGRNKRPLPWFFLGVSAFCIVIAMEEISWGQRVLGYSPPRYFLENNYQQEFNLHNVMATRLRKQLLAAILVLYGLMLPLLNRAPKTRPLLGRLGITAPPAGLAPIAVSLLALLWAYPLRYTGELIEAGMGLVFLFSAIAATESVDSRVADGPLWPVRIGAVGLVVSMGFGGALWSRGQLAADPVVAEVTATEIRALEQDFRALARTGGLPCGKHERVRRMAKLAGSRALDEGRFRALSGQGLSDQRAEFFIDPWSTAYWTRTTCNDKRHKIFVYSFGPNRRRDSGRWTLDGDDIGVIFRIRRDEREGPAVARRE